MPRTSDRTAYCRQQAATCASAAAATKIENVREAYLNLEQAWLELAPEIENSGSPLPASAPADKVKKRRVRRQTSNDDQRR
jgi:hypothetical protein